MQDLIIRPAQEKDIPSIDKLLYQVHKVHSDVRPMQARRQKIQRSGNKRNNRLSLDARICRGKKRTYRRIRILYT